MHTPAPWLLSDARSTKVDLINSEKGHAIGEIVWVDVRNPSDAKLIAAAPDLLEALKICESNIALLLWSAHPKVYSMWLDVVRSAIDKAIGEKA
jgi:hypothetical protein